MARAQRRQAVLSGHAQRTPKWAGQTGSRVVLTLHVHPNARSSGFAGTPADALRVRVTAPAADGRANQAPIDLLGRELGLARGAIKITHGANSRRKTLEIELHDFSLLAEINRWDNEEKS